jgi:MYXO-CTERM domain-containing protein
MKHVCRAACNFAREVRTVSGMRATSSAALFGLLALIPGIASGAVFDTANFTESTYVSTGLSSITGLEWAPDGSNRLFVIQKGGTVRIVKNGSLLPAVFATEAVYTNSECGLIGIAFDPNFPVNGYVYLFVTVSSSEQQIIRYTGLADVGTDRRVILNGLPTAGQNHDGGSIGFGPDGKLYWAIGDLGNGTGVDNNLTSLAAKIGRANPDGTPVNDNPFFDGAGPNNDYIWARGFRNPFTLTFQPSTFRLWVNTVGTGYEQVFVPQRGDHAGYNDYENNQPAGYLTPVIVYRTNDTDSRNITGTGAVRSGNTVTFTTSSNHGFRRGGKITIAGVGDTSFNGDFFVTAVPSNTTFRVEQTGADATSGGGTARTQALGGCITGGTFYDATAFPDEYRGNFFFGDLNSGLIVRANVSPGTTVSRVDTWGNNLSAIVDMTVGPDGALYYATHSSARIYRTTYNTTTQKLIVSRLNLPVREGGRAVFSVRLATAPASNVTVDVAASGDSDLTVTGGSSLTFTAANYTVPQAVTVSAEEDLDNLDDVGSLAVSSPGLSSQTVQVTGYDNDPLSFVVSTSSLTVDEGGSATFTVALSGPPAAALTVSVTRTGDTDVTVSGGATLSFDAGNYATPQSVTISAAEDPDGLADNATISIVAPGVETRFVPVTSRENEPSPPAITSTPVATAVLNAPYVYDVEAVGLPAPTYALTAKPAGMEIVPATGVITWTPAALGSASVTVTASNGVLPNATQSFTLNVVNDGPPACILTKPTEGATVSGEDGEFFGDGVDDVGTVKAEFYVDGQLGYTDENTQGHYHFGGEHFRWNTAAVRDGQHTVRMVVHDTAGQTCTAEVQVTFENGNVGGPNGCGCGTGGTPLALLALGIALRVVTRRRPQAGARAQPLS